MSRRTLTRGRPETHRFGDLLVGRTVNVTSILEERILSNSISRLAIVSRSGLLPGSLVE